MLLAITSGWGAVYDLSAKTEGVTKEDSIVDLTTTYLGVSHTVAIKVEKILLTYRKASFVHQCLFWIQDHLQDEYKAVFFVSGQVVSTRCFD